MDWSIILELGKAFGVPGVILFALGYGGWRIVQRLMPKVERHFDDYSLLVASLRDALGHFGQRMTIMDERSVAHGERLDEIAGAVQRIEANTHRPTSQGPA